MSEQRTEFDTLDEFKKAYLPERYKREQLDRLWEHCLKEKIEATAEANKRIEALEGEVLEYKVDAERYRFMKRHDMTDVYSDLISYRLNPFEFNPVDLDSVIDEALKEVK